MFRKHHPILSLVGLCGFAASVAVHLAAVLERPSPLDNWSWALPAGFVVLFLPLVGTLREDHLREEWIRWRWLQQLPVPLIVLGGLLGLYTLGHLIWFVEQTSADPKHTVPEALTMRALSAHCMFFYFFLSSVCAFPAAQRHLPNQRSERRSLSDQTAWRAGS